MKRILLVGTIGLGLVVWRVYRLLQTAVAGDIVDDYRQSGVL